MVKRYFVTQTADLEEDAKGDWVRASDYAAIESKLGECEQALFDAGRLHGETLRTLADERSRLDARTKELSEANEAVFRISGEADLAQRKLSACEIARDQATIGGQELLKQLDSACSRLDATEKERLDLLARVGYAEGAGEEGLRRWELAEERCKALSSRLGRARELLDQLLGELPTADSRVETVCKFLEETAVESQSVKSGGELFVWCPLCKTRFSGKGNWQPEFNAHVQVCSGKHQNSTRSLCE